MRVLILHSELGVLRGGGENFTKNLFSAFIKRGHSVSAAIVADHAGKYPIPLPHGIQVIPIQGWWARNLGQAALAKVGRSIFDKTPLYHEWECLQEALSWRTVRWHNNRFRLRLAKQFAKCWTDFDSVYVHGDPVLAALAAQHRPTIIRLPGPVGPDLEPILRSIHAVCANGDALRSLRLFLGDHVSELPIGINSELFKPGLDSIRSALNWTNEHLVFGYVGRLTRLKGSDLLAAAFRDICVNLPNARLLIVGQGELEAIIRSILAAEIGRGVVHIEPDVPHGQLPQWYRAMDCFIMPSRYENFSNAIMEAIACGVPVLATNVGGNSIFAERAGDLFCAGSSCSLTAAVCAAAQELPGLKRRAEIVSRDVRRQYDWSASADRLESIFTTSLGVKI